MRRWLLHSMAMFCIASSLYAQDTPHATLKVLTYNVLADDGRANERVPALFAILKDSDADIILMQEAAPWFVKLLYEQEWLKNYNVAKIEDENGGGTEYVILSKAKVLSAEYRRLPGRMRRGVAVAKLSLNGRTLSIATAHLESFLEAGPIRAKQLDDIFSLIKDADDAIFAGDFNFGDGEEPDTSHLDKKFTDVWSALMPKNPGYTWNIETSAMAKKGSFPNEPSRRLDRILLRSDAWKPEKIAIIGDKPIVDGQPDLFPSDHFGLSATLTFKK